MFNICFVGPGFCSTLGNVEQFCVVQHFRNPIGNVEQLADWLLFLLAPQPPNVPLQVMGSLARSRKGQQPAKPAQHQKRSLEFPSSAGVRSIWNGFGLPLCSASAASAQASSQGAHRSRGERYACSAPLLRFSHFHQSGVWPAVLRETEGDPWW